MTPPRITPSRNDRPLVSTEPGGDALATYRSGLCLLALRSLGDADVAEDVAQETLSRALTAIRGGSCRIDHLGAFIHGIARHVIADVLRAREHAVDAAVIDRNMAIGPDPLTAAVTEDERARVHDALTQLSQGDELLLRMSFFEGLTPAEVATRLGEPALRVRKRKSRALARFRQIFLGGHGHDPEVGPTEDVQGQP